MRNVCIVGVGLIGGSLGMALRRVKKDGRAYHVSGLGRHTPRLWSALRRGALDKGSNNPKNELKDADIIVLCVPVQFIVPTAKKLLPFLKKGAILTDVGSVKGPISDAMKSVLKKRADLSFVGAHPMAGSEQSGVEHAEPDLFRNATCIITRPYTVKAFRIVHQMWKDAGANCLELDAHRHDEMIALTSHLPHLMAFSLFSQVLSVYHKDRRVKSVVAGSFSDMTRVAASNPAVWSGIFGMNQKALNRAAAQFMRSVKQIGSKKNKALLRELSRLSREKTAWLE